jgi:vancomycin aglycone glucosyltransferase
MRIALVAAGTRGDVHPMIELGARLLAAGHAVRLCAPPDFGAEAAARDLEFRPVGDFVRQYLVAHAGVVTDGIRALLAEAGRYAAENIEAQFASLPDATAGCDWVIAAGLPFAAASCAELNGAGYRYVSYCPAIIPSAEHPSFLVPAQWLPRWLNRVTWWLTQPLLNVFLRNQLNHHRRRLGLPLLADAWRHFSGDRVILAADRALAPAPADAPFPVSQVPCLHGMRPEPLPAKLESFLAAGPAPVYLGFGSMPDPDPAATTRVLLDAATQVGVRAVVSAGWAGLGGGALPEGVTVIGSVSHAALFPRVAAVVHHGGAGTTTSAARAGVPQIVVPHFADQHYWARRVELLGLGPPPIRRQMLSAGGLAEALDAVVGNEILVERAVDFGERLRGEAAGADPIESLFVD